jgi:hypothetical protein
VAFFDLVVTWIEYAPWFVCLYLFSNTTRSRWPEKPCVQLRG